MSPTARRPGSGLGTAAALGSPCGAKRLRILSRASTASTVFIAPSALSTLHEPSPKSTQHDVTALKKVKCSCVTLQIAVPALHCRARELRSSLTDKAKNAVASAARTPNAFRDTFTPVVGCAPLPCSLSKIRLQTRSQKTAHRSAIEPYVPAFAAVIHRGRSCSVALLASIEQ